MPLTILYGNNSLALTALLVLNFLWFGAGAVQFGLRPMSSTFGLVEPNDATLKGRKGIAASFRFLGGLNLALAALMAMSLLRQRELGSDLLKMPLATAAIAHSSQFFVNLPVAIKEARGRRGAWRVGHGLMRVIFIIDAVLAVAGWIGVASTL